MNEEILEGLRAAIAHGQSLQGSINALLNAGYSRAEVEEAARAVEGYEPKPAFTPIMPEIYEKPRPKPVFQKIPRQPVYAIETPRVIQRPIETPQRVMYYEKNSSERLLIIVLVSFLIFLVGVLILLFVFRKDLINFFSSMFAQ